MQGEDGYDVVDVLAEQAYLQSIGATEQEIENYGKEMMGLVDKMEGHTDNWTFLDMGHN